MIDGIIGSPKEDSVACDNCRSGTFLKEYNLFVEFNHLFNMLV